MEYDGKEDTTTIKIGKTVGLGITPEKKIFAIIKHSTITTEALEQFKKSLHFKNLKWTIEIEKNGTVQRGENNKLITKTYEKG